MMERARKASLANAPIPGPLAPGGNQWLPQLLRMPEEMVTGTIESEAALADGTFSDKVRDVNHPSAREMPLRLWQKSMPL
jgi:hypothetical protein